VGFVRIGVTLHEFANWADRGHEIHEGGRESLASNCWRCLVKDAYIDRAPRNDHRNVFTMCQTLRGMPIATHNKTNFEATVLDDNNITEARVGTCPNTSLLILFLSIRYEHIISDFRDENARLSLEFSIVRPLLLFVSWFLGIVFFEEKRKSENESHLS